MIVDDVIIRGGTVITCDAADTIVEGDVHARGGVIVSVGSSIGTSIGPSVGTSVGSSIETSVRARPAMKPKRPSPPARVIDARGCAVIPGFVQAHVHLCQALFRGLAADLPLLEWLRTRVWPLEAAHDETSMRASAELGLAELLRAGTTALLDMGSVHHYGAVIEAITRSKIRAVGGKAMMDRGEGAPRSLRESTRDSLRESERLAASCRRSPDNRFAYAFAPRFVLSCSEELVRGAVGLAADAGAIVHTHAAEHQQERSAVRRLYGASDFSVLRRWGVRGPRAVLVHGVHLTAAEARVQARDGTRLVHCPSANLKLGSGVAPIARLREAGICTALGSDGAPCNDNHDPFVEMRHAALLAQWRSGPGSLRAREVLRMATIEGARVLGLEDRTGSIEVGKRADIVVVKLDDVHTAPALDPVAALVYAAQSRDVRYVLIEGEIVVDDGEVVTLDTAAIAAQAKLQARRVARRAGLC